MTKRRFLFIALFAIIIVLFWMVAQYFNGVHQEKVRLEQEELAKQQEQEAAQAAYRQLQERLSSGNYGAENEKVVFLTFDDGPMDNSDEVLDILKANDVKATFFSNGRDSDYANRIYKRIVDEGHTLANHTWDHEYSVYHNPQALMEDIQKLENYQTQVTGAESSKVFRFPGGSETANQECVDLVAQNGYNFVDWNVEFGDGLSNNITSDEAFKRIIDGVHSNSVSVVLAHSENPAKSGGLEALDNVIKQLKSEGYTFMKIEPSYQLARFTQPSDSVQKTTSDPGLNKDS